MYKIFQVAPKAPGPNMTHFEIHPTDYDPDESYQNLSDLAAELNKDAADENDNSRWIVIRI